MKKGSISEDASGNFNPGQYRPPMPKQQKSLLKHLKFQMKSFEAYIDEFTSQSNQELLSTADFNSLFNDLKETIVAPTYALPRQNYAAPPTFMSKLYTATPWEPLSTTHQTETDPVVGESGGLHDSRQRAYQ